MKKLLLLIILTFVFSSFAISQEDTSRYQTEQIDVNALMNGRDPIDVPNSIGIITEKDFQRNNSIFLMNTLNIIPGVKMEMRTSTSGTRIVIRGYGNGTNFNGIGYKAYLNGISLTDADGTTTMDDVDFTTLSRVEVIKGPVSSLYGTGIGGVVNLTTERVPYGSSIRQEITGGSYGLFRTNTTIGLGTERTNLMINYGHQTYDGFRIHGRSLKDFGQINGYLYSSNRQTVSIFANYTHSYDLLSGQVDSIGLYNYPDTAEVPYLQNDAHIGIESGVMGISHDYKFSDAFSNLTSVFVSGYTLDQPFAAGLNRTNKWKFGTRTAFLYSPSLIKDHKTIFTFGGEFVKNISFNKSYALSMNVLGAMRSDFEVKPEMYYFFAQADVNITPSTIVTLGSSYNFIEYRISDMLGTVVAGSRVYASGVKRFDPVLTPKFGLNQFINKDISVYLNVSRGYSPPTTNQVVITNIGVVNTDLKPEDAWNYEIGSKGSAMNKKLNYDLALFRMNVKDKLVPQNFAASGTTPSYTITTNAGEVRYNGLEAFLSYDFVPVRNFVTLVRPFVSYTYSDFYNIDFKSDNNNNSSTINYDDKKVSGVAPNLINAGLDVQTKPGLYLSATYMYTDETPISLNNDYHAPSYGLLNAKLGFRKSFKKYDIDVFAGSDNMTSETYSQMNFINLTAAPGTLPKFYNPGPEITFYGGLYFRYLFNN